eukprot:521102-Pelagomonas_calceolata.AAC.2
MWVAWHRQALKGGTVGLMVMLVVVVVMMVGMRARGGRAQRMVRAAGGHIKAAGHAEGGGGGEGLVRHLGRARVQQCGALERGGDRCSQRYHPAAACLTDIHAHLSCADAGAHPAGRFPSQNGTMTFFEVHPNNRREPRESQMCPIHPMGTYHVHEQQG